MPHPTRRLVPLAFALLLLAATAPTAAAYSSGYPTQRSGNRGADVRALQGLLTARGYPVVVDGVYSRPTWEMVNAFQAARGLGVSGIVGARTWEKLVVPIATGSTGEAVKALQRQLNEKRFARLAVTGIYNTATRAAVVAFQKHMGLAPAGTVGPVTWRNLLWHYDYPAFDGTSLCDYTDEGNGTRGNWGTGLTIGALERAAMLFATTGHGGVAVGDISLEHGGNIAGHATHEVGLDVDLRLVRKAGNQCLYGTTYRLSTYDREATRILIQTIRAAAPGHVKLIYFNDPVLIAEGLTTRYLGHDDHLHVRYCVPSYALAMYRC
jgi:peptidoglycan hydrolase-like protein with peptidoglycan-binding domain